jgi:hypothetical protein
MWHAVGQRGPDCVSQAANSAIELVDHTLRTLAPNSEVLTWHAGQAKYADEIGTNTGCRTVRCGFATSPSPVGFGQRVSTC